MNILLMRKSKAQICKEFSQLTYHQEKVPTSTCSLSVKDKPKCIY